MVNNFLRRIILLPSFYGFATFSLFGLMYLVKVFDYEEILLETKIIYVITTFFFFVSTVFFGLRFKLNRIKPIQGLRPSWIFLLVCFIIGLYGLVRYILDFSAFLGGIGIFFGYIVEGESLGIRQAAQYTESFGTQLTYMGWIFFTLSIVYLPNKTLLKLLPFLILILIGNLLYIDRTRPVWILFTTLVMILLKNVDKVTLRRMVLFVFVGPLSFLVLFNIIGETIGKTTMEDRYGKSPVPLSFQNAIFYSTSGFAYFNRIVSKNLTPDYVPARLLYPAFKVGNALGINESPPSQILEFQGIPFLTNVGTFLEPYYMDGGFLYVLIGVLVHSFLFNYVSVLLLQMGRPLAVYAWANLCFINVMSNFTPKISAFPIWLVFLFVIIDYALSRLKVTL